MPAIVPIQIRNGTAAQWTSANPVLLLGERGIETDTGKEKSGDGVTAWNSLSYIGGGSGAATQVKQAVTNSTGAIITKGSAVYVNGANGTNVTIALAQANAELTSSKTLGLVEADIAINGTGYVIMEGVLTGLNTSAAGTEGDPVWLSPTVAGGLVYGVANKPVAPYNMVYMGVVSRKNANNGEIFIKVQNGFELNELHDVSITTPLNWNIIRYDSVTSLWKNDVLPTASTTVLGGVKVDGTSITIDGSGVISGASTYTLPTASTTVLGGVKVDGTTITIADGVISAVGGGGGSGTVTTISVVSDNGFAGTVANATTTPAITLKTTVTGILYGDGTSGVISASKVNITQPLTGATLTLADNSSFSTVGGYSVTLTATNITSLTLPLSGTLVSNNTDTSFTGKQSFAGTSSALAAIFTNAAEVATVSATAATSATPVVFYTATQSVMYYTTAATGNWTINLRHSSGTTLNTAMSVGQCVTVTHLVTQGATAYYNSVVQVDGTTTGVTTKWQGGTAPASGDANAVDVYTYAIIKTGAATFTVLAAVSKFA